ncbi:terminase large subunit [Microcystis phage Mwe-JY26]
MIPSLEERKKYRSTISTLTDLLDKVERSLETQRPLEERVAVFLRALTDTDEVESQYHAINGLLTKTKEQYDAVLLGAAHKSLSCFVEYMTPDEPPARHHDWMCEKLEAISRRENRRLIVSMPPGHAKSKFCSRYFPAWYLGKFPNHKFIQGGHSQDFVENQFGKFVRGIIKDPRYATVFPEIKISSESSAAGFWGIAGKMGTYLAKGVGQGISGFRGNIACVDDPFAKLEDAESATIRQKVFDWFTTDFITRLLPNSPVFIVSTRWHTDDLCGRLETMTREGNGPAWEIINLPAIATGEGTDALGRGPGQPLWPEYYDEEYLLELKNTLPSKSWNALYMGKPVDAEGGVVKADWFVRYNTVPTDEKDPITGVVKKRIVKKVTVSVDCASKTTERNDWTVVTVWIETIDRRHYLVDLKRERVEFDDLVKLIEDTARKWSAHQILVEDKGSGTTYLQVRRGKAPAPLIPIQVPNASKEFRFDGVSPMFKAGDVLLPERAPWLADYEAELLAFPNATFDDQVDSTSQYLEYVRPHRKLGTLKLKGTH